MRSPNDLSSQVSKINCFVASKAHQRILARANNNFRIDRRNSWAINWFSDSHWHYDVLVFVIAVVRWLQILLGVSVFEFKRNLCITNHIEKILQILSIETNVSGLTGIV